MVKQGVSSETTVLLFIEKERKRNSFVVLMTRPGVSCFCFLSLWVKLNSTTIGTSPHHFDTTINPEHARTNTNTQERPELLAPNPPEPLYSRYSQFTIQLNIHRTGLTS